MGKPRTLQGIAVILLAVLNSLPGDRGPVGCYAGEPLAPPLPPAGVYGGIYPTVVTPFCDTGIDTASLAQQIAFQLQGGVHGLLLLGTFGEGQYVTPPERAQVIATGVRASGGHVPVIVGVHTCGLDVARAQLLEARELGASAVLVKYLGNPGASPGDVLAFYAGLAELHALPILYYHYPKQTGLTLSPQDVADILSLPGVVGIKESTLDLREMEAHIKLTCGMGKLVFCSTALQLTQFLDLGGSGAMCPEAVVMPGPTVQAYSAYVHGRHEEARCLQKELFVITPLVKDCPPPTPVARTIVMCASDHKVALPMAPNQDPAKLKAALNCMGVPTPTAVKCPLPPLTAKDQRHVDRAVGKMKAIDWCEAAMKAPPVPLHTCPCEDEEEGGMLLKTGAFQLGPGVGKDLLRSQGDGEWGFR